MSNVTENAKAWAEILEQPLALQAALDVARLEERLAKVETCLGVDSTGPIILTGMGASFAAACGAASWLTAAGVFAFACLSSELLHFGVGSVPRNSTVVFISQSGESAEVVALARLLAGRAFTIAVTNVEESALARVSSVCLPIAAGDERYITAKTYMNSLAVLLRLYQVLSHSRGALDASLSVLPKAVGEVIAQCRASRHIISEFLEGHRCVTLMGRGSSYSSAYFGALLLKETVRMFTEATTPAEFRHGPIEVVDDHFACIIFTRSDETLPLDLKLAKDICGYGGRVLLVGPAADLSAVDGITHLPIPDGWGICGTLFEVVPIQVMAVTVADSLGYSLGEFRHGSKVTTQE